VKRLQGNAAAPVDPRALREAMLKLAHNPQVVREVFAESIDFSNRIQDKHSSNSSRTAGAGGAGQRQAALVNACLASPNGHFLRSSAGELIRDLVEELLAEDAVGTTDLGGKPADNISNLQPNGRSY
jgi:hypothetical protein